MQLQLWIRLRLRLRSRHRLRPCLRPRLRPRRRLWLRLRLLVLSLRRMWRLSSWTGISAAGTARSRPPPPERMLVMPIHDRWVPKYVNWCCVIICTFLYPFVVPNKLHCLFQATSCRTPACSAVSPGGQPARRDSSEGSHDTLLVRLFPPQRAFGPLEAGDHTFHFTVSEMTMTLQDTLLLMGLPCEGEPLRAADISADWRMEFLARFANVPRNDRAPAPYQEFANAHRPTLTWLQQFSVRTFTSCFSSVLIIWRQ
jgi:hypothetical protein